MYSGNLNSGVAETADSKGTQIGGIKSWTMS